MFRILQKQTYQQASWEKAQKHAKATLVGRPINYIGDPEQTCECCGHFIQKQQRPLCRNSKELQFLGVGFPLYFVFLKYCIILMFLESICTGIIGLSDAIQNNYDFCVKHIAKVVPNLNKKAECASIYVYLSNVEEYLPKQTILLRVAEFVIILAFLIYMRDSLTKLIGYYDQRNTTFSDYSIILKYLPRKDKIKQAFQGVLHNYQIHSMTILGSFQHIQKLQEELSRANINKKNVLSNIQSRDNNNNKAIHDRLDQLHKIQADIEKLQRELLQTLVLEQDRYLNDQIVPETIIISFQSNEDREDVMRNIQKRNQIFIPEGWTLQDFKKMEIIRSPEPRDIIWENLSVSRKTKYRNRVLGWIITCTLLIIISIIFYFALDEVAILIQHESEAHHQTIAYTSFYLLQVLIIFINKFLLSPVLHKISFFENYFTKTSQEYSYSLKYLLSMFFTSALMTVLVEGITQKNYYVHKFGVIDSQSVMIILNSFMIPLIWLINPWVLVKKVKQWYYRGKNYLTQTEANEIMEKLPYTMGKRYAEIVKIVWLVSLYESLIPWAYFCATVGLALYYWVDKYNLLRKCSVKEEISGKITMQIMSMLEISLVIECCGQLFFDTQIRYEYSQTSIVFVIISAAYILSPKQVIIEFIHGENFKGEEKRLDECIYKLGSSYSDLHPILGNKTNSLITFLSNRYNYEKSLVSKLKKTYNSTINQITKIEEHQSQNEQLRNWKIQFNQANTYRSTLLKKKQYS